MTINSQVRTAGPFIGNGVVTGGAFTFKVFNATDVIVVETSDVGVDRNLVYGTDYNVTLNSDQNVSPGGTINYLIAGVGPSLIPTGYSLNATSEVPDLQPVALTNNGGFFPKVINDALDRVTILIQQVVRSANATIQFPLSDGTALNAILPNKTLRANKAVIFDASGNVIVSTDDFNNAATAAEASAVAAEASAVAAAASAAQFQGTSATSVLIATGTKAFTTQSGKLFNGENVRVYSAANVANYMDGLATYSGTSLSVNVTSIGGSGTFTDWVIKVNGDRGPQGAAGEVTGAASSVDSEIALFSGTTGKVIKRATGTGYAKVSSGVFQTPAATIPIADGGRSLTTEGTIASATTTDLGTITTSNILSITGTTTITSLGSSAATTNPLYFVRFTGALTLTHNGTSLILPSAANITTVAGDTAVFKCEGSGNWRCMSYDRASGAALAAGATKTTVTISNETGKTFTDLDFQNNDYEFWFRDIDPQTDGVFLGLYVSQDNFANSLNVITTAVGQQGGAYADISGETGTIVKNVDNGQTDPYSLIHGVIRLSQLVSGQPMTGDYSANARREDNASPSQFVGDISSEIRPTTFFNAVRLRASSDNLVSGSITMIKKPRT